MTEGKFVAETMGSLRDVAHFNAPLQPETVAFLKAEGVDVAYEPRPNRKQRRKLAAMVRQLEKTARKR